MTRALLLALLLSGCTITVRHVADPDQLAQVRALAEAPCYCEPCPTPTSEPAE